MKTWNKKKDKDKDKNHPSENMRKSLIHPFIHLSSQSFIYAFIHSGVLHQALEASSHQGASQLFMHSGQGNSMKNKTFLST
jgi:hypothetical protein